MENENIQRRTTQRRSRRKTGKKQEQPINYTQPKPFVRKQLIVQLLTIAAVVLAIFIGVSVFFKVDTVLITGAEKYSVETVAEASGLESGDSLLFFGRAQVASRIKQSLPYVGTVRFEVKLPGTVNIIIEEKTVAYAVEATDGSWWKITADGMVVEQVTGDTGPTLTGIQLKNPAVGEQAVATDTGDSASVATPAEKLAAALTVMEQLERWVLFDQTTSLDVSDLVALRLYCQGDFRVELQDTQDMDQKIGVVRSALLELSDTAGGVMTLLYKDEIWQIQYNPWSS